MHTAQICNGRQEYCDLSFNQFTFPGTHSSGSGFDGPLRRCQSGAEEDHCIWQTQNLTITAQLQLGIRFFTIDTCILPEHCITDVYNGNFAESRLMACQGGKNEVPFGGYRYAGFVTQILSQISDWMDKTENRNEVIGLQFTNKSSETNKSAIIKELIHLLEARWCPDSNNSETCSKSTRDISLNTHYNETNTWPTLSHAIDTNSRIFIFIEAGLNVDQLEKKWMNLSPVLKYSFTQQMTTSNDCSQLVECAQQCNISSELVSATGYMLGICNTDVQQDCNSQLSSYVEECYQMRQQYGQTVNVILVNYPEQANLPNTVFEVAKLLNERNVKKYLPTTRPQSFITTTPITGSNGKCVLPNCVVILLVLALMLY